MNTLQFKKIIIKLTNLKIADNKLNCFPSLFTIAWAASVLLVFVPLLRYISWLIFETYWFKEAITYSCS